MSHSFSPSGPPVTVQQHILQEQLRFPGATGEFSFLLSGITLAAKRIQAQVRRAGLREILGSWDSSNVHGEVQQKLDIFSNDVLIQALSCRESVGVLASEENEHPTVTGHGSPSAKYAVIFDPLDGSSNIDVNVSVGTTFSIFRKPDDERRTDPASWVLQPGHKQIAAGYVVYGSSTVMVYTVGNGVHGFTLDPEVGAFIFSHENIRMPDQGKYYSVNEAYRESFPAPYNQFIDDLRGGRLGRRYASRYIGSMVSDFHRTLLRGGVFMYPPTRDFAAGKLRLLYEANPIAFIAEQAGGVATNGFDRILNINPETIHQRTPFVVGSQVEMVHLGELHDGKIGLASH
jgi:fructose-1,6-bisphosphatase I